MTSIIPQSEQEAADAIAEARAAKSPLVIEGGGTRGIGRPLQAARTLSTRGLSGVSIYNPAELVISVRAGTPMAEIEAALDANRQILPFEPMDHRALLGEGAEPTIGGITAGNHSGPRRIQTGAARDALIGLRLVNGRAEIVKTGGRVMKNVTGLDLVKLNCGAQGTLGLLTEVTYKLLPRPETEGTIVLEGLADAQAIASLSAALGSPFEVSGAAHLPAGIAGAKAQTAFRVSHLASSVAYRLAELTKLLGVRFGAARRLDIEEADALWRSVGDARPFAAPDPRAIWRISTAPTRAADFVARVSKQMPVQYFYDWGGGLIWLATEARGDAGAAIIRAVLDDGHATLVRAPADIRAQVDVFQPLSAPLLKITQGIKASFDPDGILNPGRMYAGV